TITKTIQDSNSFHVPVEANRNQTQLNIPHLTEKQKRDIDVLAAMWCFLSNHLFNMFESPSRKKFLQALHPAYKPPSQKTISGPLLDKVYEMTKTRTDEMISNLPNINVITNKAAISKVREFAIFQFIHPP